MASDTSGPLYGSPAVSPEALKLRRQMMADLLKQGQDTSPIRSPWQGAARLAQTLVGVLYGNKLDKDEYQERKGAMEDWVKARQSGDTAQMQAVLLGHPWLMQAEHLLSSTTNPILSGSANGATGQYPGAPTIGQTGQPPQPLMPRAGGPAGGGVVGPTAGGPGAGGSGGPIPPQGQAAIRQIGDLGREQGTANILRQANEEAMKDDLTRMAAATKQRQQLRLLENTLDSTDFTRGDAGPIINRIKQGVNGLFGANITGDTSGPEFIDKLRGVLSRQIASTSRGATTDLNLSSAQSEVPGDYKTSKEGALKLTQHLIQMANQDEKLGNALMPSMKADPDNYITNRNKWLGDPKNALTSPLTGKNTSESAAGMQNPNRYIWSREKGLQPQ